jgi:ABC-type glucose/galactose transport system permease subunit
MKYAIVFLFLLGMHFFLNSFWLIVGCCSLGVGLALVLGNRRFPVTSLLLIEILIGVFFRIFIWNRNNQLEQLARNSNVSPAMLAGVSIGANMLMVFLCVSSFYYCTKYVMDRLN